jgi:hypothetical protein
VARENQIAFGNPQVNIFFPFASSVDPDFHAALSDLGVNVILSTTDLSMPFALPSVPEEINLDTTTLCALVSMVSNEKLPQKKFEVWASSNVPWEKCYKEVNHAAHAYMCGQECATVVCVGTVFKLSCARYQIQNYVNMNV